MFHKESDAVSSEAQHTQVGEKEVFHLEFPTSQPRATLRLSNELIQNKMSLRYLGLLVVSAIKAGGLLSEYSTPVSIRGRP